MKNLKKEIEVELKKYFIYTFFLALLFSAFLDYKRVLLDQYSGASIPYGYAIIEALILAKVVLLGEKLKIGEHFSGKPLIIPVLYKTFIFSGLFLFVKTAEIFITGLILHRNFQDILQDYINNGVNELLAGIMVLFFVFVFFFAFLTIGDVVGRKRLFDLFFKGGR